MLNLLTHDMTAEISDMGVARILKFKLSASQPNDSSSMHLRIHIVSPEAMVAPQIWHKCWHIMFSCGILMIHILSGKWSEPRVGPSRLNEFGKQSEHSGVLLSNSSNIITLTLNSFHISMMQAFEDDGLLLVFKCCYSRKQPAWESARYKIQCNSSTSTNSRCEQHCPGGKLNMLKCHGIPYSTRKPTRACPSVARISCIFTLSGKLNWSMDTSKKPRKQTNSVIQHHCRKNVVYVKD